VCALPVKQECEWSAPCRHYIASCHAYRAAGGSIVVRRYGFAGKIAGSEPLQPRLVKVGMNRYPWPGTVAKNRGWR
jgi:hypothetical protein